MVKSQREAKAANALKLWDQAAMMVKSQREAKLGQQITLDKIVEAVQKPSVSENPEEVTAEELIRLIDEMPIAQADSVIERCRRKIQEESATSQTLDVPELMRMVLCLNESLDAVKEEVASLVSIRRLGKAGLGSTSTLASSGFFG